MRKLAVLLTTLTLGAAALSAQERGMVPEVRPFVGVYVPTAELANLYGNAALFGAQLALEKRPTFHLLGTFSWVPGKSNYGMSDANVNIFQYDVGGEFALVRPMEPDWVFKPFLGLGAGGRTYSYKSPDLKSRTCFASYGSLGTELQLRRVAFRFEGRDNVFCYKAPIGETRSWIRNDLGFSLGLAYHFR